MSDDVRDPLTPDPSGPIEPAAPLDPAVPLDPTEQVDRADALDVGDALARPPAPPLSDEELMELAASAPVPSSDEMASMAAAAATALPLAGTHGAQLPDAMGDEHASVATAPAVPHRARRLRIKSWGIRLGTLLITLALFAGGLALGALAFDRSQPPAPTVGDPSTGGVSAPAIVRELADALATNNSDSLRSAVSGDPYRLLAGEIQSWNMQGVTSVQTLATMQDGPRSVTEIIITGRTAAGDPLVFNLVVHVTDNQIVNFR
jgi:hypothetical protein